MSHKACSIILCAVFCASVHAGFTAGPAAGAGQQWWKIPPALPAEEYGNILINRTSVQQGVKPVTFSHWIHRRKHTCRVCHFELEINMKVNSTEITEAENRAGKFCGACHDGKVHDGKALFGHEDKRDCGKCHNGDRGSGREKIKELEKLPSAQYGNRVNWGKALDDGMITPVSRLTITPAGMGYDKKVVLDAEWWGIPPAVFPHLAHIKWLDCNNCHPDIFNIKKKTTKHFLMTRILKGEFCGVCHLTVAFPLDECKKCHPGLKKSY